MLFRSGGHVLMVKGRPFLIRAAELHNSSFSSARYMNTVWKNLTNSYINTVLAGVTWEAIEPEEGTFDFASLNHVVQDARLNGLHLILLWFGAFKNGMCALITVTTNAESNSQIYIHSFMGKDQLGSVSSSKASYENGKHANH